MSRGMRLSVLGLYTFNNHLFDEMKFPSQFTEDDKMVTINNILCECAELEILFPDYDMCKAMIGLWSRFNLPTWERIYKASLMEYNPIENYNRTEIETINSSDTDSHTGNDVTKHTGTDTQLTSTTGKETNNGNDTNLNKVTGYNGNQMVDHDQATLNHSHTIEDTNTGSNATNYGKTETLTHGETISRVGENTRENHTSGNIGVTTSQQMLEQEIDISYKINIFSIILESFKDRFCLLVY